jgi:two-component system chemotaxis sensor kinase CheA
VDANDQLTVIELEERVEQICAALNSLRSVIGEGKAERRWLEETFRQVHTLKASAQTHSFNELTKLAHECENVLHSIRIGRVSLDDQILSDLDQLTDMFFEVLRTPNVPVADALLARLAHLSQPSNLRARAEVEIILSALPSEMWQSLNDQERYKLQESVAEGSNLFLVSTDFAIADFDRSFQELKDKLTTTGEIISTAPTVQQDHPDSIDFRILYTRQSPIEAVRADVESLEGVRVIPVEGVSSVADNSTVNAASDRDDLDSRFHAPHIRVSLDDLDQIISSAYGLAHQIELVSNPDPETVSNLRRSSFDLAAAIVSLRMTPIDRLLKRVVRAGRTAARSCDKEVEFQIYGQELLLDQAMCDAIIDPLIHLVRNAIDHGIEPSGERGKHAKSERGTITIGACAAQGQTRIAVSDDGRGIDPAVIEQAAARLGLQYRSSPLTLDESVRMIFRPGFTTASTVSETSGRGVGLDIVETEIERLGGQVRVATQPGAGATFEIRLPVTFGLLDVVTVRVGKQRYLIDQSNAVAPEDVEHTKFAEFKAVKLVELLGQRSADEAGRDSHALLFCEVKNALDDESKTVHRVALLLDEVETREQIVVRDLGSHGSRWFGVAGAGELRDGSVALLLDLPRLLKQSDLMFDTL